MRCSRSPRATPTAMRASSRPPRARCRRKRACGRSRSRSSATSSTPTSARGAPSTSALRSTCLSTAAASSNPTTRSPRRDGCRSRRRPDRSPTRASERWCSGHCCGTSRIGRLAPVRVLNFYSSVFADQLRRGRKTATIRLGDKSHKYRKNDCVLVTIGYQHSPREKIFYAVIDQVEVKRVRDLSPRDIEHDNPEFRRVDEMVHFLEQIYGRKVSVDDTVTVVRFSQIIENPPEIRDRMHGLGGAQN